MPALLCRLPVLRPLAVILAVVGLIGAGTSHVRATGHDRLTAFLEITGFDVALDSIALSARDAPGLIDLAPEDFGMAWPRVTEELFETGRMREMAIGILAETLDDEMLAHAAEFYASELGQRLVRVENSAHMQEDAAIVQAEGEALLAVMAGERRAALQAMNEAIDGVGQSFMGIQEIQFRFLMAASEAGLTEGTFDEKILRRLLAERAEEMRETMRASALAHAAQTYRSLSTADLSAYARALEHPVMRRVYELMNAVQYEIMGDRFAALATRLAEVPRAQEL